VNAISFAPVFAGAPLVLTVHDVSYEIHPEFFHRREVVRNRLLVREGARRARFVTTISETSRRALIDWYGLRPESVVAILCGVSEPFLHATAREVEPIGDRPLRLLAVGNLQPRKNLPRLLEAVGTVARRRAVRLRVVGAGGFQAESIRAALESSADVEVLGYVSEAELVGEYDAADMLVYPSIYEGFGLPVVEAMARGLPVITSTGGALPEVAADAALLVDPFDTTALADAILRLADDAELRRLLVARGRLRAGAFTWTSAADALRDVYRQAIDG
jgi:glycosyltransferase involved in cell wall biosynthesis